VRYFLDTEFNGFGGGLVAIAAVPEGDEAAPFYEAVECPAPKPWVAANVLPVLHTKQRPLAEVARMFSSYLAADADPVLIADWPEDIGHAVALLTNGRGGRLVGCAVRFELLGTSDFASEGRSEVPHNAYYDAVALRDWVVSNQRG
jgi:hypothetical protein